MREFLSVLLSLVSENDGMNTPYRASVFHLCDKGVIRDLVSPCQMDLSYSLTDREPMCYTVFWTSVLQYHTQQDNFNSYSLLKSGNC